MSDMNPWYGTQALTFAIPLGFFTLVLIIGFFQRRRPSE
jgi:hypothetical protein